ncbi:MAG: hypothetical protein QME12_07090 [Nanoarchaeota archaeon]|nr:hypothetical protein [Nanoarchaeota archaeon]
MNDNGINYILDSVLCEQPMIDSCIARLAQYNILFVSVHCPLEKLKKREIARGDRIRGIAEMQFPHVHKGKKYDLEVHTDQKSPYECATIITDFLKARGSSVWVPFSEKFYSSELK